MDLCSYFTGRQEIISQFLSPEFNQEESAMGAEEEELKTKVKKLVGNKFEGNWRKAFEHYQKIDDQKAKMGRNALDQLLKDADVGSFMTRGLWVDGILKELDQDKDGLISWDEFEVILDG
jgi:hypothetical protein